MNYLRYSYSLAFLALVSGLGGQQPRTPRPAAAPEDSASKHMAVDVTAFGCKADGVTDDTACLNAAEAYVKSNGLGKLTLPAGTYYVPNGWKLDADGLSVEGAGANPSPTPHGTVIKCKPASDCLVVAGSTDLGGISVRDLTITHGGRTGTGSCLVVDGTANTISKLRLERLEIIYCGNNGLSLLGGSGRGGFVFNVTLKDIDIDRVGGTGFYAHGRVSQVHGNKLWIAGASAPFIVDGSGSQEAGNMDFELLTAADSDHSHYCMQLRDVSGISVRNPHLEDCPYGLVLFQSAQNITFDGGGYYQQEGSAYGFTFDAGASSNCDCNIVLDPQGATNTSTHKFIRNTGAATIADVRIGWASRHRLTRADLEGAVPEYTGGFPQGFVAPLLAGDKLQFPDASGRSHMQGALFDAVWRDPSSNVVHIGSGAVTGPNGIVSDGPAHFERPVSIGKPGDPAGGVLLDVHGVLLAAAVATPLATVPYSATPVFDAARSSVQKLTLAGHVASSALAHAAAGQTITFLICQDARGGWSFQWPPEVKRASPVGLAASACTIEQFLFDGSKAYALAPAMVNQ